MHKTVLLCVRRSSRRVPAVNIAYSEARADPHRRGYRDSRAACPLFRTEAPLLDRGRVGGRADRSFRYIFPAGLLYLERETNSDRFNRPIGFIQRLIPFLHFRPNFQICVVHVDSAVCLCPFSCPRSCIDTTLICHACDCTLYRRKSFWSTMWSNRPGANCLKWMFYIAQSSFTEALSRVLSGTGYHLCAL